MFPSLLRHNELKSLTVVWNCVSLNCCMLAAWLRLYIIYAYNNCLAGLNLSLLLSLCTGISLTSNFNWICLWFLFSSRNGKNPWGNFYRLDGSWISDLAREWRLGICSLSDQILIRSFSYLFKDEVSMRVIKFVRAVLLKLSCAVAVIRLFGSLSSNFSSKMNSSLNII